MNGCGVVVAGSLVFLGLLLVGGDDADEAQSQVDHYCQMVKKNIESCGENGWPDFENKYDKECAE